MTPPDLTSMVLPDVMSVQDLAIRLHRSPSVIRDLLRRGLLPGCKIGRRWIVERRAFLQAISPDNARFRSHQAARNARWQRVPGGAGYGNDKRDPQTSTLGGPES